MKKIVSTILTLSLIMTMTACGKDDDSSQGNGKNTGSTESKNSTSVSEPKSDDTSTSESKDNNGIDLMYTHTDLYTFKEGIPAIEFDYPNLKSIGEGLTRIFKNNKFVIAYTRSSERGKVYDDIDLIDIPDELSESFARGVSTHILGDFTSFKIDEQEEKEINGTEVLMIKGHIVGSWSDGSTDTYPMKGYTFTKNGTIFQMIGFLNEKSNDEYQAEMEKTVDAMISTLRFDIYT